MIEQNPSTRILIFGNSGSGKSTLARALSERHDLAHLDLDTLAWEPDPPPTRRSVRDSERDLRAFTDAHSRWVVEGCYADLLELLIDEADEMYFLDPGVDRCVENCRARPFEPHKYESKEAQDANLEMLLRVGNTSCDLESSPGEPTLPEPLQLPPPPRSSAPSAGPTAELCPP